MTIARNVSFSEVIVNHAIIKLCYFREKLEQETLCSQRIDSQSPFFVRKHNNKEMYPSQGYTFLCYFLTSTVPYYSFTFLLFPLYLISSIFTTS